MTCISPAPTPLRPYVVNMSSTRGDGRHPYKHGAVIKTDGARNNGMVAAHNGRFVHSSPALHAGGRFADASRRWAEEALAKCAELNDDHEVMVMVELGCAPWHYADKPAWARLRERLGNVLAGRPQVAA